MTTELVKIHDTNVECPYVKGQQYVSVESICAALDIEASVQIDAIKSSPLLKHVFIEDLPVSPGNGLPKKKAFCIPLKLVFGWAFTIDATLIPVPKRKGWYNYMLECYTTLYDHFYMRTELYEQKEKKLTTLHEKIVRLIQDQKDNTEKLKKVRAEYDQVLNTPVGQLQLQLSEN